jgi:poly-beta-1,6-N-acetyl-D-glucosamine synthase
MYQFFTFIRNFFDSGIFVYSVFVFASLIILAMISAATMIQYMRKNSFIDYNTILGSPLAPSISVIAPAFNEGKTIIDNIRSLLSLHYHNFDVIIVNDGSTDDSLERVIQEYDLEPVKLLYESELETMPVRAIYRSRNKAFSRLIFIDKENGGKADSINAALNVSGSRYFMAIDVDCILEEDSLLKMVKPFMEETDRKVVATGGVVRIANSCKVENGKITEVNVPRNLIARMQVLEYTRSFLMGRMAWSRLNGLLIISGAFGMFDRETVMACGGYSGKTLGEDMELVVRVRRYMHEKKEKYRVVYIPDPLCWTEVPSNINILGRQRNRWTRGNIGTLLLHRKMFLNPRYGLLGMLSYPYWVFVEWMAPIVETLGIFYFLLIAAIGEPSWSFFALIFSFVYFFATAFSAWSILFEELSYHRYKKTRDLLKMIGVAFIEPLFLHPLTVWFGLRGNYHYFIGKTGWGKQVRAGFSAK